MGISECRNGWFLEWAAKENIDLVPKVCFFYSHFTCNSYGNVHRSYGLKWLRTRYPVVVISYSQSYQLTSIWSRKYCFYSHFTCSSYGNVHHFYCSKWLRTRYPVVIISYSQSLDTLSKQFQFTVKVVAALHWYCNISVN